MLRPRIIPCLLIRNKGLVKTVQFKDGKYVGDPLNAVKIFNEKEVDELMVLDIDATVKGEAPNYALLEKIAIESRMPLCYGGGIKTAAQARKIVSLGFEKIAISSEALENPEVINQVSKAIGSQSVVIVLDVKKKGLLGNYVLTTHNGTKFRNTKIRDFVRDMESRSIGEFLVNSVDNDGVMKGYDMKLIKMVRSLSNKPLTVIGGAGSINDVTAVIDEFGVIGAAAGSIFVFKGKYKAVLINYPSYAEKRDIIKKYLN